MNARANAATVVLTNSATQATMTAAPDPVRPGEFVQYAITVTNSSGSLGSYTVNAQVPSHNTVPAGSTGQSGSCNGVVNGACPTGKTIRWSQVIGAGQSVTPQFAALVDTTNPPPSGTLIRSTATANSSKHHRRRRRGGLAMTNRPQPREQRCMNDPQESTIMNTASVRRQPDASAVRRFRSTDTAPVLAIALPSRAWTARCLVLLGALILMPKIAIADDPCEMPVKHVKAVAAALGKAAPPGSKPGRFEVRTISFTNEPDKFQVSYLIDGRPVFSQRLEKRDEISEHFVAGVSRNLPSVLDLSYAFGARGAISCEYKIARAQTGFVIRKTK